MITLFKIRTMSKPRKQSKTELIKTAVKSSAILGISVVVGALLLILVFALPNGRISRNVENSLPTLNEEGMYPALINGTTNTMQDNFSDTIMLNIASYNENEFSTVERAMLTPRYIIEVGGDQIAPLNEHYAGKSLETLTYGRYWHGYLAYLRPLLTLFNYDIIRFILFGVNLALSAWYIILLYKKAGAWPVAVFVLIYILEGCFIGGISLMNFNMIFVTQISGIVLLQFYEQLKERGWLRYFFLITGILTSYFDLLTFPVVTLGINLCLIVLLDKKCNVKELVLLSLMWCVGYAGMWVMKWVVGSLLTGQNIIADGFRAAESRSSNVVETSAVTYFDVLERNFSRLSPVYISLPYVLTFICGLIWVLRRKDHLTLCKSRLYCLIFIIAIPFVWYFLIRNHSYIHIYFTIRTLMPALIGVLLLRECFDEKKLGHKPTMRRVASQHLSRQPELHKMTQE